MDGVFAASKSFFALPAETKGQLSIAKSKYNRGYVGMSPERWSNDIYLSTPHRVTNPAGRDRYSVVFFLDSNPDVVVACLPGCATERLPSKYPAILAADYLASRLAATYG